MAIGVVIIDDERLIQTGFQLILDSAPGIEVLATCAGADAVAVLEQNRPEVVLLDLSMPEVDGVEILRRFEDRAPAERPFGRVIVLTTFAPDERMVEAIRLGADGFLFKDLEPEELIDCVHQAAAGRTVLNAEAGTALRQALREPGPKPSPPSADDKAEDDILTLLSQREREVLSYVAVGRTNAEIGAALHLSAATVKDHVSRVLEKMHCENRTQAAVLAAQFGLTPIGRRR